MNEPLDKARKYYWVWIECQRMTYPHVGHAYESILEEQALIDIHPLAYVIECNEEFGKHMQANDQLLDLYRLRNWKEITEEEYNLYKDHIRS